MSGELSKRLQQDVSGRAVAGGVGGDHRLVDERHEQIGHVVLVDPLAAADLLRRREGEAGGEHAEPTEQHAFVGAQQVVAPLDGAQQRPLATFGVPIGSGEQAKALVEPIENLSRRQRTGTGRREFQRQRDAVETPADAHHRVDVVRGHRELGRCQLGTFDEQADRIVPVRLLDRGLDVGQRQRRHPVERFAGDTEPFPAGGQHAEVRAGGQQISTECRGGTDDLFAVVEHEQHPLSADVLGHRANQRGSSDPRDGETLRDLVDEHVGIANRTEFGHAKTVGEVAEEFLGDAHRQPRLARSPGSGQRHQPMLVEQTHHVAQFACSTDEARQLRREVIVRPLDGS